MKKTLKCGVCEPGSKKHPCPDCTFCQWCSDSRCGVCLSERRAAALHKTKTKRKSAKKTVKKNRS